MNDHERDALRDAILDTVGRHGGSRIPNDAWDGMVDLVDDLVDYVAEHA